MAETELQRNLIFDIGMHRALDTKFYLDKGFRVVALEANPAMVASAKSSFSKAIEEAHLTIVDRALWATHDDTISFFVNNEKDDWSSAFKGWAEKEGHKSQEIKVSTITLSQMFDAYGVPYYIKCDIEGADELFVRQLHADRRRPAFVSVEAMSFDLLALLYASGYDRVQIVNQQYSWSVKPPEPAREGSYVSVTFTGHMSGLFGKELEPKKWVSFAAAAENYLDHMNLKRRDERLAPGWLDFHVTTSAELAR
jgi:FkbM family methyltransferase